MEVVPAILCYHRIGDTTEMWPYFERGTAVRVSTFERQLADITRGADVVGRREVLEVISGACVLRRPAVWLTFDDAYREVVTTAAPLLQDRGCAGTVFVTTATLSLTPKALPADRWYGVLLSATRRAGVADLGMGELEFDLERPQGRARLVHGPERKAYLRAAAPEQEAILAALARAVCAEVDLSAPSYLTTSDLRDLVARGWSVGSHGATHAPFDSLADDMLENEARASRDLLEDTVGMAIDSLALPDGRRPRDMRAVRRAGYRCVLGLGNAPASRGEAGILPRFIVPDDPEWVSTMLLPALETHDH